MVNLSSKFSVFVSLHIVSKKFDDQKDSLRICGLIQSWDLIHLILDYLLDTGDATGNETL